MNGLPGVAFPGTSSGSVLRKTQRHLSLMVSVSQQDNKPLAHGVSLIQTVTQSLNSESHCHAPSADEQLREHSVKPLVTSHHQHAAGISSEDINYHA